MRNIRGAKILIALIMAYRIMSPACLADIIASYSASYTTDLEQKQVILESIREPAGTAVNGISRQSRASGYQDNSGE